MAEEREELVADLDAAIRAVSGPLKRLETAKRRLQVIQQQMRTGDPAREVTPEELTLVAAAIAEVLAAARECERADRAARRTMGMRPGRPPKTEG
jgi:hypothetical protein